MQDLQLILGVGPLVLFVWLWRRWIRWRIALARVPTLQEQERVRSLKVAELETPFETAMPWVLAFVGSALFVAWTTLGLGIALASGSYVQALIRGFPNGETHSSEPRVSSY